MLSSGICLRCQSRLLFRRAAVTKLTGKRFESTTSAQPVQNPNEFVSFRNHKLSSESSGTAETKKWPRSNSSSPKATNRLEKLFQSNASPSRDLQVPLTRYSRVSINSILPETDTEVNVDGNARGEIFARMERMLESEALSPDMWSVWLELNASHPRKEELEEYKETLDRMFHYMIGTKMRKQFVDRKGPKVAQVLSLYQQWDMVSPQPLEKAIRLVLTRLSLSDLLYEVEVGAHEKATLSFLLSDLLLLWKYHFFHVARRTNPTPHDLEYFPKDKGAWIGLPSADDITVALGNVRARSLWRYKRVFPTRDEENAKFLSSAVSLTHLFLYVASLRNAIPTITATLAKPFLDTFTPIALGANRNYTQISYCLTINRKHGRLQKVLSDWWDKMLDDLEEKIIPKQATLVQDSVGETFAEELAFPLEIAKVASLESQGLGTKSEDYKLQQTPELNSLSTNIRKATAAGNIKGMTKLWQKFVAQVKNPETRNKWPLDTVYADFLWGFVGRSRLEEVSKVWESMKLYNVTPSPTHWNALLEFALKTRVRGAASNVWQQMTQDAQVRPDNQSWTIYFTALMRDGRWREALSEIAELGKAWTREKDVEALESSGPAGSDAGHAMKVDRKRFLPSMTPVNAILTGLLTLQQPDATKVVINWSRSHGLKADVVTYNIFMRSASRKGDRNALIALIDEMKANDIQADATTLTMLLHGLIRGKTSVFNSLSLEEQEALVSRELDAMHASGIPANEHTYSTLLAALVSISEPNLAGARVLLDRLSASGMKIPSHIYTTLIRHYFSTDPPNLQAIENLWNGIEKQQGTLDHIGYDRLIEGWAEVGNLQKVLFFLKRLTDEGNVPGWLALQKALEAMVKERDWEMCEQLVYEVERRDGLLRVGERGWVGETGFWNLVEELRRRELIPGREDMGYVRKRDRTSRERFKDVVRLTLANEGSVKKSEAEQFT